MPRCRTIDHVALGVARRDRLRHLDAHVLDWIGVDLRADEALDGVEQAGVGQGVEHRWSGPERRVGADPLLRQRKVEVLRVHGLRLRIDLADALGKRQIGVPIGDRAALEQLAGERIEDAGILVHHGIDHLRGVKDILHGEEAKGLKMFKLRRREGRHGRFFGCSWTTRRSGLIVVALCRLVATDQDLPPSHPGDLHREPPPDGELSHCDCGGSPQRLAQIGR